MTKYLILTTAAMALAACAGEPRDVPVAEIDCRTGLYRSAEGDVVALTPVTAGGYRWRKPDGTTGAVTQSGEGWASTRGWTGESDGAQINLGACEARELQLGPQGAMVTYARVPLEVQDVTFEHDGLSFSGRLIWPAGQERAPLAVHVHGSERWSAVRSNATPYLLAAEGIASFVYDKRGTGRSEGQYTQDFHVLAADAIAALEQARALAGDRITRTGFIGGSQGGWIGPLAASQTPVDFVVALYGMAEGPLAEDRAQVMMDVANAGFGAEEQARAAEIADAAGVVIASGFKSGFREFDVVRNRYKNETWYRAVEGEFTGEMLPWPEIALRVIGPFHDVGTSWEYDPMPVLRALDIPQFWMIAAEDSEAPPEETIRRIRLLQSEGEPIDLAIYPNADHSMVLLEANPEGEPRRVGQVRDYFRQIAGWINARDLSFAQNAGAEVHAQATAVQAAP
ncbi:MAG TPA: alpha/beta fold hydrolase [Terricaulis sp.]|nr:alpha/beta fold hydrolase [Terricaulis sp.]